MARAYKRTSAALAEVAERTIEELSGRTVILGRDMGDPKTIYVSKLSFDQWIAVALLAVKVAEKLTGDQKADLEKIAKSADSGLAAMVPLFLNKETMLGLVGILANVDEKWLDKHFSMAEVVELLDVVDEAEDLRRVIAPFQRIAKRWRSSPATGPQPSA